MKKQTWKKITGRSAALLMAFMLAGSNLSYAAVLAEDAGVEAADDTETGAEITAEVQPEEEPVQEDAAVSEEKESVSDAEESVETEEPAEEMTASEAAVDDGQEDAGETVAEPETPEDESEDTVSVSESTEAEAGIDPVVDNEGEAFEIEEVDLSEADDALISEADDEAEAVADESSEDMVIEDVVPQQLADGELIAPVEVHWSEDEPGTIVYKAYADQKAFYFLELYKNGERIVRHNTGDISEDDGKLENGYYIVEHRFFNHINYIQKGGSGTYTVRVKAGTDSNDKDFSTGAVSGYSEEFDYTAPEAKLAKPQNVRWSPDEPGVVLWDPVPNANYYWVELEEDGRPVTGTGSSFSHGTKEDFSDEIGDVTEHEYTASVCALTSDIYAYFGGDRAYTGVLQQDVSGQTQVLTNAENAVASASSREEAEQSIRDLWNETDIDEMKIAMQTKEEVRDAVQSLEDAYTGKADINVKTFVTDDAEIDAGKDAVSILGAGLNATAGSNVTFTIDKADAHDDHIIDTSLWVNVTRFDMDIDGVVTDSEGNLMFPVTVTMPMPANVTNRITMRILHYHHSDNGYDLIVPRFNSDGTVSFTVTHFSEFVFAEEKPDTTVKPGDTEIVTELGTVLKLSDPVSGVTTQQIGESEYDVYLIPKDTVITGSFRMFEMRRWDGMDESDGLDLWLMPMDSTAYYQTFTMTFKGGDGYEVPQYQLYLYPDGAPEEAFEHPGPIFAWDMRDSMFTDVKKSTAYYFDAVYWAVENGITKGYSDGSFGVGRNCERRELMIFLWRYAGCPTVSDDARTMFNDLSSYGPTSATNQAIAWAYKTGITKGYSDGGFHPKSSIVRKDVMIMLYRLAGKPAVSGSLTFKDCQNLKKGTDTYNAILWGSNNGITKGYSSGQYKGMFGNNLNCLREQIVTFLYRYSKL